MLKGLSLENLFAQSGTFSPFDDDYLSSLKGAGIQLVRLPFRLNGQPAWTPAMIAYHAAFARTLIGHGFQVIGLLEPDLVAWTQAVWDGEDERAFLTKAIDFAEVARSLIGAVPQIAYWEVWNEPNSYKKDDHGNRSGGTYIKAERLYTLLSYTTNLLWRAKPGVRVITGGLFAHSIGGRYTVDNAGAAYLARLYGQRPKGAIQVPWNDVGLHLYPDQGGLTSPSIVDQYLGWIEGTIRAHHPAKSGARIHLTEVAWDSSAVGEHKQAANLTTVFNEARGHMTVASCCWHQLRDQSKAGPQRWGLCHDWGGPKAAYAAYTEQPPGA